MRASVFSAYATGSLKEQSIHQAIIQNSTIALEIDNAKLAAEDFQNKWQTEQGLRMSVESDIDGLHNLKATYLQLQENLTDDIAGLEDEIAFLKKNHEEELRMLRQHRSQDIQVEVDSEPGESLEQVMAQLREQYAKMAGENKAGMEKWYQDQLVIKQTTVAENTQAMDGVRNELSQYRHQMQEMEMEYNSLLGSINALGNTLGQIEGSYEMQLHGLQTSLAHLEGDLGRIRQELMHQNGEYEKLLNIKMRLEAEIGQYRVLLSGHQGSSSGFSSSISSGQNTSGGKVTITSVTESRQTVTK
ncbi:keratin, type I cytoskeletal 19-like [Rhinoraja longicauda]